jgi:hypothetical protein
MNLWTRFTDRLGPQPDLLGFTPTATPTADVWLHAFTDSFMSRSTAAYGTDALMSGLRFFTADFVAQIQALPPIDARQPPLPGRIPRAVYATVGPIIVDVYQNVISHKAGRGEIRTAFLQAMPGLLRQNDYIIH